MAKKKAKSKGKSNEQKDRISADINDWLTQIKNFKPDNQESVTLSDNSSVQHVHQSVMSEMESNQDVQLYSVNKFILDPELEPYSLK